MYDEYNALVKNVTWLLVLRPTRVNMVRSMWLFKHKFHADGTLSRYKARLVANGSSQKLVVDFDKTFSPVVKPATIHTVLSLAVSRKWPIYQLDVKNSFLNGDLSETVYMHQPSSFVDASWFAFICMIRGSLTLLLSSVSFDMFEGLWTLVSSYMLLLLLLCAEAEYRGVANIVAETAWLRNLLREFHSPLSTTTLVYRDNISVVYMLEFSMYLLATNSLSVHPPPALTARIYGPQLFTVFAYASPMPPILLFPLPMASENGDGRIMLAVCIGFGNQEPEPDEEANNNPDERGGLVETIKEAIPTNKDVKKEEEAPLDGEFIKVEKETAGVNDDVSRITRPLPVEDDKPCVIELSREVLNEKEKINEPKLELEKVATTVKQSEYEHTKLKEQITTLPEELQAQESNQKELVQVKESFETLNNELESSRKRMQELETKRALEFESLLYVAQTSAKEMEDQIPLVQEELKGLYEKIADHEKVEEALKKTIVHLSVIQEELEALKLQVIEIQQKHASQEAVISELTEELNLKKHLKELAKSTAKKEDLKAVVVDFKSELAQTKERCSDLEAKLQLLSENDTLLTQAKNLNLIKSVLEKSTDHEEQANSNHQRSVELEDIIQSLSSKSENNAHLP
ncbi:ribonuclease H-like domain-containing protein [Tanacetum coccineum]